MVRTVQIITKMNAAKIVVDGNEINDVLSYALEENAQGAVLALKIAITGEIEARIE